MNISKFQFLSTKTHNTFSVNEFKTVYVFENKSWNGRVPAGGKVNVGFEGKFPTGAVDTPVLMGKDFVGMNKEDHLYDLLKLDAIFILLL